MQSLLFKNMTLPKDKVHHPILSAPTKELFEFLRVVDPDQAARLHPSDRRKIETRVQLYLSSGRPATELFKQQKQDGVETRWDTLVFWVWSARDELNARLDTRVDKMILQGAEQECRDLYEIAQRTHVPTDSGIFQTIGLSPHARLPHVWMGLTGRIPRVCTRDRSCRRGRGDETKRGY